MIFENKYTHYWLPFAEGMQSILGGGREEASSGSTACCYTGLYWVVILVCSLCENLLKVVFLQFFSVLFTVSAILNKIILNSISSSSYHIVRIK